MSSRAAAARWVAATSLALAPWACSRSANPAAGARGEGGATSSASGLDASIPEGSSISDGSAAIADREDDAGDAGASMFDAVGCSAPAPVAACDGGFCAIPAGCFVMGSPPTEWGHPAVAEDQVAVTLTRAFEIAQHETTQAEWTSLGFDNPSTQDKNAVDCADPQCPVGHVTWFEALSYANERSRRESGSACYALTGCTGTVGQGLVCSSVTITAPTVYDCAGYRLPTDAEWEYAARAGTATPFYSGDITVYPTEQCAADANLELIAWYCLDSSQSTHPVQGKQPNGWGLYDMIGNLDEWVNDVYRGLPVQPPGIDPGSAWSSSTQSARIARGCDYNGWSTVCRVANQYSGVPSIKGFGFRLARTLGTPGATE
jgi:formylglycine-generating enzyme required for sulfatase activity